MCVISMVSDHWYKQFEQYQPTQTGTSTSGTITIGGSPYWQFLPSEVDTLRKMIADYYKSMAAAKTVDDLTGQPDCIDPEKAKLQERVAELEKQLQTVREALK